MKSILSYHAAYSSSHSLSPLFISYHYTAVEENASSLQKAFFQLYPFLDPLQYKKASSLAPHEPKNLHPVPIMGPSKLKNFVSLQNQKSQLHMNLLSSLEFDRLEKDEGFEQDLVAVESMNKKLKRRVLNLVCRLERYILLSGNLDESESEIQFRRKLFELKRKYEILSSKLALVDDPASYQGRMEIDLERKVDELGEEGEEQVLELLESTRNGLERMILEVRKNVSELQLMREKF
eukprot:augustus_masked-scaffold_55-processed-gene-1.57-mRNA-1 protein AED:1.00 eAED:1.00 QI:0/-1/0/0/-1/1/1/0/235